MVSTENKEIKVTASDALEFEPVLHESSGGGWGLKIFLTLILVGAGAGAWVLYGDKLMQGLGGADDSVPLIKAATGPVKVRPENPGGLKVPNRDKLVYDRMQQGGTGEGRAPERLLPAAEEPLPKPKPMKDKPVPEQASSLAKAKAAKSEKLIAAQTPPKKVVNKTEAKAPTIKKVPSIKDVNTAKRPTPPPPPPAPPSVRSRTSGSSFTEPAPKVSAPAPKAAPVKKVVKKEPAKVAVKTPAPVPKTATAPVASISRDKAYLVQLAAGRSSEGARKEWNRLKAKHLDVLIISLSNYH